MASSQPSRREFVTLSGTAAAVWFGLDPGPLRRALEAARASIGEQSPQFHNLTAEQALDLEAIAAQIIPTDDLPGAREARVIVFMDRVIGEMSDDQRTRLFDGLGGLNRQTVGFHLLGTCRMGNDPATSVVDRSHRTHDVPNLFLCDGSSFVTSGRGQPTCTIQGLAYRAADHIAQFARRGEI